MLHHLPKHLLLAISLLLFVPLVAEKVSHRIEELNDHEAQITITVTLDDFQGLLENSLKIASNNPAVVLQPLKASQQAAPLFDKSLNDSKNVYTHTAEFTLVAQHDPAVTLTGPRDVILQYLVTGTKEPREYVISDLFTASVHNNNDINSTSQPATKAVTRTVDKRSSFGELLYDFIHRAADTLSSFAKKITSAVPTLLKSTQSLPLQMILVLLLGILMSLTPCIYPMIPITVGVLGANPGNSLFRNFSLAFTYTCGMATTFAVLGLLASFFGTQSGQLLANPWFVGVLVFILGYLGLSMFGFYEMYIPAFLQPRNSTTQQGSLVSAFFFGAASGTIASPCMSPGLALVLTIVAGLGNAFLGFLLLFIFGLGSGLPLLLVGTFSSSLQLLPRAGMWMLEVKKVFGFLLIVMCFYYLQTVLPLWLVTACAAIFFTLCGFYYLNRYHTLQSSTGRFFATLIGLILLIVGLYTGFTAYKYFVTQYQPAHSVWQDNYEAARAQALQENKLLLLDFTAQWCPSCKALGKKLHQPEFEAAVAHVVPVIIDGTDTSSEPYARLKQQFDILGLPTVLLIDPATDTLVKQWGAELLDTSAESLAQQLL